MDAPFLQHSPVFRAMAIGSGCADHGSPLSEDDMQDFLAVYRLYRRAHGRVYALKSAWRIVVIGASF